MWNIVEGGQQLQYLVHRHTGCHTCSGAACRRDASRTGSQELQGKAGL